MLAAELYIELYAIYRYCIDFAIQLCSIYQYLRCGAERLVNSMSYHAGIGTLSFDADSAKISVVGKKVNAALTVDKNVLLTLAQTLTDAKRLETRGTLTVDNVAAETRIVFRLDMCDDKIVALTEHAVISLGYAGILAPAGVGSSLLNRLSAAVAKNELDSVKSSKYCGFRSYAQIPETKVYQNHKVIDFTSGARGDAVAAFKSKIAAAEQTRKDAITAKKTQ